MGNTLFVGLIVVIITLLLAVPAGYALARLTGSLGEQLGIGIFLTYLVPPTILFIPLSRVVACSAAGLALGARARLSELHHPLLHLAADGVLQGHPARTSRRRRWSTG